MAWELLPEEQAPETALGTVGRGVLRTGARVGESVAGLPGDVASGVLGLGNLASRLVTGSEIPGVSTLQEYLPTSEKIREKITKPLTGEYLQPRGTVESAIDTLVGDVASLLTPAGVASKGAAITGKAIGRTALKAAGAGLVGKGVGELLGPEAGAIAKGLTLGLANTAGGRKALTQRYKDDYAAAEFAIPNKAKVSAIPLRTRLGHDIKVLNKSVDPNKNQIVSVLEGVRNNIDKQGRIDVKDAWRLKKDINQWLGDKTLSNPVRGQLSKTLGDINSELGRYAKTNPSFAEPFYRAEEMYKGLHDFSTLNDFLQTNVTVKKILSGWQPLGAVTYGLYHGKLVSPSTIAKAGAVSIPGAFGAREAVKFAELFYKSPQARKYYMDMIKAAAIGDAAATAKNLKAFDQAAYKYEKSNPSTFQQPQAGGWELIS